MTINVDQHLTTEQVDLIVGILDRAGKAPRDVHAIELHAEGGIVLECLKPDPLARGYDRVRL